MYLYVQAPSNHISPNNYNLFTLVPAPAVRLPNGIAASLKRPPYVQISARLCGAG